MNTRPLVRATVGLLLAVVPLAAWAAGDAEAAARQYRSARRLAAERAPGALAALQRVIDLDPDGPLVDDALVDQALLEAPPSWPELVGGLDVAATQRALQRLDEALRQAPLGDRATEATYYRALLRLEPAPSHDPEAARGELTTLATGESAWAAAARYALAWLHEFAGQDERAFDAYQRSIIDEPADAAGIRARVGAARVLLRGGRYGEAARRLHEAIDAGVAPDARAEPLLELAVRSLMRDAGSGDASRVERVRTGVRSLSAFAATADGGALIGDRKQQAIVEFGRDGRRVAEWSLEDVQAICADAAGRRFAAAGSSLYRLQVGTDPVPVASLGDFAPVEQLAADGHGGFWILERRGRRIGRIDPGQGGPRPFWESDSVRLTRMVWSGSRLVGYDAKSRGMVAIDRSAKLVRLADLADLRPTALAADASGRVAMLDDRAGAVRFLRGDGLVDAGSVRPPEVARLQAVGLGPEGELHVVDGDGDWLVLR